MKKLMFAQSRFVFFAGGPEGPKPTAELNELSKRVESGIKVSKEDVDAAAKKGMDMAKAIDDPDARVTAQEGVKRLEKQLKQAVEAASKGLSGDVARASTDELKALNQDIDAEDVKVLTEVRQHASDVEASLLKSLKGLDSADWADAELKADLQKMVNSIGEADFTPAARGQELNRWAVKTESFLKSIDEGGTVYTEAFAKNQRRNEIREDRDKGVKEITDLQKKVFAKGLENLLNTDPLKVLFDKLSVAKSNLENGAEPGVGSQMSKWEEFSNGVQQEVRTAQQLYMESTDEFDRNKMEMEIQNDQYEKVTDAKDSSLKAITDAIRAMKNESPDGKVSPYIDKAAVKAQEAILGATNGLTEPEAGKTTQEMYTTALSKVQLAMNDFKASQEVQKVADLGGEKLAKVYEQFRKGEFGSMQEFKDAYDAARAATTFEGSEFKALSKQDESRLAELKQVADSLEGRAMYALAIQDGSRALASLQEKGAAAVDALGNMFKKGAELASGAVDGLKEAASVASIKAGLTKKIQDAMKEVRGKKAISMLKEYQKLVPGITDATGAEMVASQVEQTVKENKTEVAAARRRAAREAAANKIDMVKDPTTRTYVVKNPTEQIVGSMPTIRTDIGEKQKKTLPPITGTTDTAAEDSLGN